MSKFQGKTIVVTGVSSGIGGETAKLLRLQGACVFGMDRNEPHLSLDGFIKVDMAQRASIDDALRHLPQIVHGLANVAGVPGTAPADTVGRVNYLGLRHLTMRLLERMPERGSVVNTSSVLGIDWPARLDLHKALSATVGFEAGLAWLAKHPVPTGECYQYFKEALIVWTFQQAPKLIREKGVRMNCVAPGPVSTPVLGEFVRMLGEERVQADARRIQRPAYSDEIAAVVAFLLSDDARWICGVNLPVDGGLSASYV